MNDRAMQMLRAAPGAPLIVALILFGACGGDENGDGAPAADAGRRQVDDGDAAKDDGQGRAAVGVSVLFDLDGALLDAPYPIDTRRGADGRLDLHGFPNPDDNDLVSSYVAMAEDVLRGYSLTPSVYFRFDGPIDPETITSTSDSAQPGSNIILVNVDQDSHELGWRHPLRRFYWGTDPARFIPPNTLILQPLFGAPLAEGTTYAAIVLRDVRDPSGAKLVQPETVRQGLAGEGPLAALYEPLRFWRKHLGKEIAADDIAAATVFTTDTPTKEMHVIAKYVREEMEAPVVEDVAVGEGSKADYTMYEGHYTGPNFQAGEKPYDEGGDIRFDAVGKPIVQLWEPLRFALAVPKSEMPEKGWPIAMYGHGTGGDWKTFAGGQTFEPATQLTRKGIAVIGIDQPLHGIRYEGADADPELQSFNFLNPYAGRSNFRQSAIDVIALTRLVRESLSVPASVSVDGNEILFDPDRVCFMGHSHGGLSAGIHAPFIPELRGVVMSAGGGGLSYTLMKRKLPVGETLIADLIRTVLGIENKDELTEAHPVIALVQNLVDATDPLAYARLYRQRGEGLPPVSMLMTEGPTDEMTPALTTDSLAAAAGIPILAPADHPSAAHVLLGINEVAPPVSGNFTNKWGTGTAVLAHFPGQGHFAVFDLGKAAKMYQAFLESALEEEPPVVE